MKKLIKNILSQELINHLYHLPKAIVANIAYGFPTRKLKLVGISGTDGKTTTANMIYQILKKAGKKVSLVSTINAVIGGNTYDTGFHVTSPAPMALHNFIKKAKDHGDEYLILEATSHALDQFRFWGIKFDVGVITNITHEHLDYHKSFENYFRTKLKLAKQAELLVVNQTVKDQKENWDNQVNKMITFGLNRGHLNQKEVKLKLKIPGNFNIENALAALGVAHFLGIDRKIAVATLEKFEGISGRMEEVKNDKGLKIIIDFAHTPNGLEQTLRALRLQNRGKLISLIGCEGFRDVGKRSMMGEIAKKLSDFVIVTAVDPRGQLDAINKQITDGITKVGGKLNKNFFVIDSRKEAIDFAINELSKKGDIIGIFGKGHEISMNLDGKREISWSDKEAVGKALKEN